MTEWISCALLSATYFTSRNDPRQKDAALQSHTPAEDDKGLEV